MTTANQKPNCQFSVIVTMSLVALAT